MKLLRRGSLAGILVCVLATPAIADLSEGLVAYYPLDGTAEDSSTYSNHGTEHGGLIYVEGKVGMAANIDGIDDYISAPSQDQINIVGVVSISTWVKRFAEVEAHGTVVAKGPTGGVLTRNYGLHVHANRTLINFTIGLHDYNLEIAPILQGVWHHIVAIIDTSTSEWKIYVNGELAGYQTIESPSMPILPDHSLMIGACDGNEPGTPRYFFDGLIDELRIYDRVGECQDRCRKKSKRISSHIRARSFRNGSTVVPR